MRALQQLLPSKNKSNSLFMNLILSFLTIIILLVTFHFLTISLSSNQVREEIIKYNNLNLNHTVESYENHYEFVKRALLPFMIHDEVQAFRKERRYIKFPEIQQEIQKIVSNPLLHIHDIILYNQQNSQTLDKNKSSDAETMFNVFWQNEVYAAEFWEQQFSESYKEKFLTATSFTELTFPNQPSTKGIFSPVIFKIHESDSFYIIVLFDADKMYQQFHVSSDESLLILDDEQVLYPNTERLHRYEIPPQPLDGREYMLADDRYYFYQTGLSSGLTYVQQVPMEDISAQITIKATLMFVLAFAIVISIVTALLFIRRINNPLQQVIASLKDINTKQPVQSNIKEFHTISRKFFRLAREKQKLSYMNQLKDIQSSGVSGGLNFTNRPFVMILFDLVFKDQSKELRETENKWYLYVKEFIELSITLKYEDSLIFQTEKNQILSLVFLNNSQELIEILEKVKATLDFDQSVVYATIAVSSDYQHSSELTKAYEEVLDKLEHRPFNDETIIISESAPKISYSGFSLEQEQQFDVHLREGNATLAMKTVQKVLDAFEQKDRPVVEVASFAKNVTDKCIRLLTTHHLEVDEQQRYYSEAEKIKRCYTFSELETFLQNLINQVCSRIIEQKEKVEADYIVDYILKYVEDHYDQEVYLEELADNLKMSSGYLSTHFKNKTGNNFIDYLNGFRISKAQELLHDTDWKVKEVADKVGYQNISSFNRMFKKYTGITPGEYRKKKTN